MPWELECAVVAKRLCSHGWMIYPWQMDDLDVSKVRVPLTLIGLYELFQSYGDDVENIQNESQADVIAAIERLRGSVNG